MPDRIPLCLVALAGRPGIRWARSTWSTATTMTTRSGTPGWPAWWWRRTWRGQGIGSLLVRSLLQRARALGVQRVYFGTDGPGFYTRLGAVLHQPVRGTSASCASTCRSAGEEAGS
jgi:GNAT superfamily N-acetyltransferase